MYISTQAVEAARALLDVLVVLERLLMSETTVPLSACFEVLVDRKLLADQRSIGAVHDHAVGSPDLERDDLLAESRVAEQRVEARDICLGQPLAGVDATARCGWMKLSTYRPVIDAERSMMPRSS